jgi:hypothetical protein
VRASLERSFGVPLGHVRVHSDASAASAAAGMGARAFAYGAHVHLGPRERADDLRLMAHEVAHVLQQQGAPEPRLLAEGRGAGGGDRHEREAELAAESVARGQDFAVRERAPGPRVQKLGLSDILDGLAELAANLPGYTLLTMVIGRNPVNLRPVERNFTNLLRGLMAFIPGGELLFQTLNRSGIVERIGRWTSEQMSALGLSYEDLRRRFTEFTDSLSWRDIFRPGDVWRRAERIFAEPAARVRAFTSRLISQAVAWLKETFMRPLSEFARQIPGYTLVTVLLGRDPFTGATVARTALNVVRAFAEFIPGGTEKVNQLVESRALQRAYEWFVAETQARNLTWERVTGAFARAWDSLRLEDVLHPIDTISRVADIFRPLMRDLVSFAGAALMKLLELIFEAVMGAGGARVLAILKRARATFLSIIQNPVGFLRNLLGAVGQGVRQFRANILTHLREGVIAWLTGPVARAGVQMPERWDVRGIIWFVLQILGLTWERVRQKLVRLLGERVVATLEAGFQLVQEIRQRGLVQALRDRVTEFFGQLREAALGGIRSFIQTRLVMAGITQLVSMLNPVGAVIQAIIKTYTTINFFIDRITRILDLVESIVNSVSAIASGAIGAAANLVERTMARTIPVILDFLARFIGLGDVGGHVQRTIQGLQARVDQMLDRAVDWIRAQVARLGQALASGVRRLTGRLAALWRSRRSVEANRRRATIYFSGEGRGARLQIQSSPGQQYQTWLQTNFPNRAALSDAQRTAYDGVLATGTRIDQIKQTPVTSEAEELLVTSQLLRPLEELARHVTVLIGAEPQPGPTAIGSDASTILATGQSYFFIYPFNPRRDPFIGKVHSVSLINNRYRIHYSETGREGRYSAWAWTYTPERRPNWRVPTPPGAGSLTFTPITPSKPARTGRTSPYTLQANQVRHTGLHLTPYSGAGLDLVGWDRLKPEVRSGSGSWVQGHIINGRYGGPRAAYNLVPIPRTINTRMWTDIESQVRADLEAGYAVQFDADVNYHLNSATSDYGYASDFASSITFTVRTRAPGAAGSFNVKPLPALPPIRLPSRNELLVSRLTE